MSNPGQTVRDRRRQFYAVSGFAADGGYDTDWATETFAGLPYTVPNLPARARALRVHDLHHVLTGYRSDWRGEAEISAWELGAGGGAGYVYAWLIALFGLATGLLAMPTRTWAAFRRGRASRNLYTDPDPMRLLDVSVAEAWSEVGIGGPRATLRPRDAVVFGGYCLLALSFGTLALALSPLLVVLAAARCPCRSTRRAWL